MSEIKPTPTPWVWCYYGNGDGWIRTKDGDAITHVGHNQPNRDSNGRLITASVNSYGKHCGDRTLECAEGDLLGEVIAQLTETWYYRCHEICGPNHHEEVCSRATELIELASCAVPDVE